MKMVKVEVSKLKGTALDWAAGKAVAVDDLKISSEGKVSGTYYDENEDMPGFCWTNSYNPSGDWSIGGPLIARSGIILDCTHKRAALSKDLIFSGDTVLQAGMRAICHLQIGSHVEVPAVLVKDGE